ncbi:MAG: hypothetical protein ACE5IH_07240, partial [Thermodesulfobacteriota bacterium]
DERAVSVLSRLIKKRSFWRKKARRELNALAVLSLGKIGGKGVADLLKDTLKHSTGVVYQSCINVLKTIGME